MAEPLAEFRRAPLAPVAAAVTIGILVDRFFEPNPVVGWVVAVAGLAGAVRFRLGVVVALAALAGLHHHAIRSLRAPDDIGRSVQEPPGLAKLRGVLLDEPTVTIADRDDPFVPRQKPDRARAVVLVREEYATDGWRPASGRVNVIVDRAIGSREPLSFESLRIGDSIEAIGFLHRPSTPSNPGEWDARDAARDRQLSAELRIGKAADGVVRWEAAGPGSLAGAVAAVRGRATRVVDAALPPAEAALARALLLGDGTAMDQGDWDGFIRTGVVHVLAISGQHLVILGLAIGGICRMAGLSRRTTAIVVVVAVVGYAGLTGLRPSAIRAAVMVVAVGLGIVLRRPISVANTFSLAWLTVLAANPVDLFNAGFLLSFVSVAVLIWGASRWLQPPTPSPIRELEREMEPATKKAIRAVVRVVVVAYAVNAILFLANGPLIAARQNLISPVGLLVGPPLVLLTAIALIAGFAMLALGSIHPGLGFVPAKIAEWSLSLCGRVVSLADAVPGGSIYLPGPPAWWLVGFYAIGAGLLLMPAYTRRWLALLLAWAGVLAVVMLPARSGDELRVAFVAVGHGGCAVVECPDGRVLMSDVGTLAGPDAVRRSVSPYLWHRGIRRIDELFLSHADLDHFNGIGALLRRFPVGRITLTPSFADKPTPEVAAALAIIAKSGVPVRIAVAGDRLEAGDVTIDVLHPPPDGPAGSENERSLVLRLRHRGHSILLTGDLEKQGTALVTALPREPVDVLLAPHHGSKGAWTAEFVRWASPKFVAVSRGTRTTGIGPGDAGAGVPLWTTQTHGAITIRSHATGLTAEAYRTGERVVVKRGR
jgi:competence protein ComEC